MSAPLPPLPPAFRVRDRDVVPGGRSMIDILADEHARLTALCTTAAPAAPATDVLVAMLSRHLSVEQQYLYPTVRRLGRYGGRLADAELAADAQLLRTLTRVPDPAALDDLARQLRAHIARAGHELFPRLRAGCTPNELVRLGNRVEIAHEAAPTRPHPATPVTPPANKVVDACVGVVDKVRDVLTRRVTWPEDL